MASAARAGIVYVATVFAIGFALGTLRTLVVAPRVGDVVAVIIELPLMIGASWLVCRRLVRGVSQHFAARALMGGLAFAVLMALEFGLATLLFGRSPAAYAASLVTLAGLLGLAGQIVFGLLPLFVRDPQGDAKGF